MGYQVNIDVTVEGESIYSGKGKDLKEAQKDLWLNVTASLIDGMEPDDEERDSIRLELFPSDILDYLSGMGDEYQIVIGSEYLK